MADYLVVRLDAPLVSFGAPAVDNHGVVQTFPPLSLLVGLVGNALGYDHRDSAALQRLQERLRYAARVDRRGRQLQDFQTVDLGQHYLRDRLAWTTWGHLEKRAGGHSTETHIRYRDYRADSACTVCLGLVPADEEPTLDAIAAALKEPARPLFIGRKPCLPAGRLLRGRRDAESPLAALASIPRAAARGLPEVGDAMEVMWCDADGPRPEGVSGAREVVTTDERDWANQLHVGRRLVQHGLLAVPEVNDD